MDASSSWHQKLLVVSRTPAPSVTDLQCKSKQLQRQAIVNIWRPIVASQTDDRQETAVYDHHREDKEG